MTDAIALLRLIGLIVSTCAGLAGCTRHGCEPIASLTRASPNGQWLAIAHSDACGGGIGTSYTDNRVDLRRAGSNESESVLVPEGQWQPSELVGLNWVSAEQLQITVPNRTILDLWVASSHGINIDVQYDRDDPADRARWIAWRAENEAWLKNSISNPQSKLPQPQPPPLSVTSSSD
jgi:hypothetical protein